MGLCLRACGWMLFLLVVRMCNGHSLRWTVCFSHACNLSVFFVVSCSSVHIIVILFPYAFYKSPLLKFHIIGVPDVDSKVVHEVSRLY